jgi:hypothetical protein
MVTRSCLRDNVDDDEDDDDGNSDPMYDDVTLCMMM